MNDQSNKRRRGCFVGFISFILSLILMLVITAAIPLTLLNLFLNENNIEAIVDHIVSSIEIDKIEISTDEGNKTLPDVLLDVVTEFDDWEHIVEEPIDPVIIEDFVKKFATDAITQLGSSLKNGDQMLGWTPEQIYGLIAENEDMIESFVHAAGYKGEILISENEEIIIANIKQSIGEEGISVNTILEQSGDAEMVAEYLNKASLICSDKTLYLVLGIVGFIMLLLLLVNLGFFGSFLRACGVPALIVGGLYSLAAGAVDPILAFAEISDPTVASVVEFSAGFLATLLMKISLAVAVVGLGMIILSIITDTIKRLFLKA